MANRPARLRQWIQGGGKGMDGRIRMIAVDRLREPDGRNSRRASGPLRRAC